MALGNIFVSFGLMLNSMYLILLPSYILLVPPAFFQYFLLLNLLFDIILLQFGYFRLHVFILIPRHRRIHITFNVFALLPLQ